MPFRVWEHIKAFTAGEMAPDMAARDETAFYKAGVSSGLNNIPVLEGPVERRWGTAFFGFVPGVARLGEFKFNSAQVYLLAFGNQRLDVFYGDTLTPATTLTGCPWTLAMLPRLNFQESGDTIIVCHPDLKTQTVKRTGVNTFMTADYAFEQHSSGAPRYQPYYKFAPLDVTLTPSATTGNISLSASAPYWQAGHVGMIVRYKKKEILITGVSSPTVASGTVREALAATAADKDWDEQMSSSVWGYFNCVTFRDNRTVFEGHKSAPSYSAVTNTNAPFKFDPGTTQDTEAILQDSSETDVPEILNAVSFRHLQIFSTAGIFYIPASGTESLTPKKFTLKKQVPYRCSPVKPRAFDGATLFCNDNGKMVSELLWDDVQQAYDGPPASHLASHLINQPVDLAVLDSADGKPERYAILVNSDGTAALYMSLREQKVRSWWPWQTDGKYLSVASVGKRLVVLVERQLNGVTKYCIEAFDPALALDCAKIVTGPAATVWGGFAHLAGREVNVLSGNYHMGRYEVSPAGEIELPYPVESVEVGLFYNRILAPLPPMPDLPNGASRGRTMRLIRSIVTVSNALGFRVNGRPSPVRSAGEDFNAPPIPKNGELEFKNLGFGKRVEPVMDWPEPVRCTVQGISMELAIYR